mmetsp:Transcript_29840/g.67517  ORF Transcript_29840/g.67517 Transcript_29840/m.67517 type:complete len:226 (-) Transcript_29840:111-788(-)
MPLISWRRCWVPMHSWKMTRSSKPSMIESTRQSMFLCHRLILSVSLVFFPELSAPKSPYVKTSSQTSRTYCSSGRGEQAMFGDTFEHSTKHSSRSRSVTDPGTLPGAPHVWRSWATMPAFSLCSTSQSAASTKAMDNTQCMRIQPSLPPGPRPEKCSRLRAPASIRSTQAPVRWRRDTAFLVRKERSTAISRPMPRKKLGSSQECSTPPCHTHRKSETEMPSSGQ